MSDAPTREDALEKIWALTAAATIRALASDAPAAAVLQASRQFLADNGVSVDSLRQGQRGMLGFNPDRLPKFNDADEGNDSGTSAAPNPLHIVPPFAPPSDPEAQP